MEQRRGGTSVSGSAEWRRIALVAAAIAAVAGIVVAVALGKGDKPAQTQVGDESGEGGYQDEVDGDEGEGDEGEGDEGEDDEGGYPEETADPDPTVAASEARVADGARSTDELIAVVAGSDFFAAMKAERELAKEARPRVIPLLEAKLREGDEDAIRHAEHFLDQWQVPRTFDRSVNHWGRKSPADSAEYWEFSLDGSGDELVLEWVVWFGDELFGSPNPPFLRVDVEGGALAKRARKKRIDIRPGENRGREVMARGVGPGTYSASIFLWGHNKNTGVQHNATGPYIEIVKP